MPSSQQATTRAGFALPNGCRADEARLGEEDAVDNSNLHLLASMKVANHPHNSTLVTPHWIGAALHSLSRVGL